MEPCHTQTPSRGNRAENWRRRAAQGLDPRGISKDFPGGLVVKNSPFKAGDAGSIPDWGAKIPYAVE